MLDFGAYCGHGCTKSFQYLVIHVSFFLLIEQSEMYDRLDQASILRQDQMLKPQSLQSAPHESSRYL